MGRNVCLINVYEKSEKKKRLERMENVKKILIEVDCQRIGIGTALIEIEKIYKKEVMAKNYID